MTPRILVAYATRAESTYEISEYIAQVLRDHGAAVDVRPAEAIDSLTPYQGVLLGSAIRTGHVLPEVLNFAKRFRENLRDVQLAYFIVCATLSQDTPANRKIVLSYLDQLRRIHEPDRIGMFAGRVDRQKIEQPWRFMLGFVKSGPMAEGEYRDWDAIHEWVVKQVVPVMMPQLYPV